METIDIWKKYNDELYFFILNRVKQNNAANDIFQNTFLKIHNNLSQLKQEEKVKAWAFQIARSEIVNYINSESNHDIQLSNEEEISTQEAQFACCFDRFMNDLPKIYKEVTEMIYVKGHKQKDVAKELAISLENTKARVRRAKDMLKERFKECCNYKVDKEGKLIGEPDCATC